MRLIFVSLLLLFACLYTFAQKKMQDVVYLKNGSVLRGTLVTTQNAGKVAIQIVGNSLFVFDAAEVEKITTEHKRAALEPKKRGFANTTELGLLAGGSNSSPAMSLVTVNGYTLTPYTTIGIGTGIQFWWDLYQSNGWYYYNNTSKIIPLFADVRGDLLPRNKITPLYYARFGYGFAISPDEAINSKGGVMFGAGAGFKIRGTENLGWFLSVGYHYQKSYSEYPIWDGTSIKTDLRLRRIALQTGISF